jgi:hypothetical protein
MAKIYRDYYFISYYPKTPVADFWKKPETFLESTSQFASYMLKNRYEEIDKLYTV